MNRATPQIRQKCPAGLTPSPPSPYQVIVDCLNSVDAASVERLRSEFQTNAFDWESIIRTASQELVLPTLAQKLDFFGLLDILPEDLAEFFRTVKVLSGERNQQMLAEMAAVSKLLNAAEIEPVLLKGAAYLIAGVYKEPSSRFILDIDLLVEPAAFKRAVTALIDSGYVADKMNFGHHYYPLRRGTGPSIELHHTLGGRASRSILPDSEILRNSAPSEFAGAKIRLPSAQHLIIHHILHSQIHHAHTEGIWPSLRSLYDLLMLQRRFGDELNWQLIIERFRLNRREAALAIHLMHAERIFGKICPISVPLKPLATLRWYHIQALRRFPEMRWIDPIYFFSRGVIPRSREFANRRRIQKI